MRRASAEPQTALGRVRRDDDRTRRYAESAVHEAGREPVGQHWLAHHHRLGDPVVSPGGPTRPLVVLEQDASTLYEERLCRQRLVMVETMRRPTCLMIAQEWPDGRDEGIEPVTMNTMAGAGNTYIGAVA